MENELVIRILTEFENDPQQAKAFRDALAKAGQDGGGAAAKGIGDRLRDGFRNVTRSITSDIKNIAGLFAGAFAFRGIISGIGNVRREFQEFENDLNGVRTLLNSESFGAQSLEDGFSGLKSGVLDTIREIPVELSSVNKALFDTVSAGIDASKAIDVVGSAGKLAVAGLTDISVATNGITTALNAYGRDASEAEDIAAKFFEAQRLGKTTVDQLSNSLGTAASIAANTGTSFEELLASVSAATLGGIGTAEAFTGIRAALSNVLKPTEDAAKEAERLGINFSKAGIDAAGGFVPFLQEIVDAGGDSAESLSKLFGSTRALTVIQALAGKQAEALAESYQKISDSGNATAGFLSGFESQTKTLQNQQKILQNNLSALRIEIGERLAPVFARITTLALNLTKGLSTLVNEGIQGLTVNVRRAIVALTALFSILAATRVIGIAIAGFAAVSKAIGAITITSRVARVAAIGLTSALTLGLGAVAIVALEKVITTLGGVGNTLEFVRLSAIKTFQSAVLEVQKFGNRVSDFLSIVSGGKLDLPRFEIGENIAALRDVERQFDVLADKVGRETIVANVETNLDASNLQASINRLREEANQNPIRLKTIIDPPKKPPGGDDTNKNQNNNAGGLDIGKLNEQQAALRQFVIQNAALVESNRAAVDAAADGVANSSLIINEALSSTELATLALQENLALAVDNGSLTERQQALFDFVTQNQAFVESNRALVEETANSLNLSTALIDNAIKKAGTGASAVSKAFTGAMAQVKKASLDVSGVINNTLQKTVVQGTQVMVNALIKGENAFEAFGKLAVGLIGDFLIQVGQMAVSVGIATLGVKAALQSLNPVVAIAAGAALIALGTAFRSLGSGASNASRAATPSVPATSSSAPTSTSVPTSASEVVGDQDDFDPVGRVQRGAQININVQGDILDSDDTSLRLVQLLENASFLGAEVNV